MQVIIKNLSFGNLPESTLIDIFKDGRASSKLMENFFANHLGLEVVLGDKAYDLISSSGKKYELKAFSKYGCDFSPSMHKGDKGLSRRIFEKEGQEALTKHKKSKKEELINRVKNVTYLIYNIVDFPIVDFELIEGSSLLERYPNGKISPKKKEVFFE